MLMIIIMIIVIISIYYYCEYNNVIIMVFITIFQLKVIVEDNKVYFKFTVSLGFFSVENLQTT